MTDALARSSASQIVDDVVCPFCGLGCDDLVMRVQGDRIEAQDPACPGAARLFARAGRPDAAPRLAGRPASHTEAAAEAGRLLVASRSTLIAGLGADVAGVRALVDLAIRHGGALDHYASPGLFTNLSSSQRTGWLATTLAEVRNRCDLFVMIGADPTPSFERFFDRALPPSGLFLEGARRVVFLGGEPGAEARAQIAGADIDTVPVEPAALAGVLGALAGALAGRRVPPGMASELHDRIGGLAGAMKAARYVVLCWNAGDLPEGAAAESIVADAVAIVDLLNATTRAAVFPLGGRDDLIGAQQVMLWRLGYPLRTAIRGQVAAHDPWLYATETAAADSDLMLWVSSFRPEPPPDFAGKLVALAHPDTPFARPPEVFVPVGTPGIDHEGQVFRMDQIVCLPVQRLRDSGLPSVEQAVRAILAAATA